MVEAEQKYWQSLMDLLLMGDFDLILIDELKNEFMCLISAKIYCTLKTSYFLI